jgi:hypothetical protein
MRSSALRALALVAALTAAAFAGTAPRDSDPIPALVAAKAEEAPALDPDPNPEPAPAPKPVAGGDSAARAVPGSPSAAPGEPALDPGLSPRERLRRARLADREAIRAERRQRSLAIHASRDSARRLDNFYFGAGLVRSQYEAFSGSDSEVTESSAPLGIWFGYRTHFARFLGLRAGGLAHFGSTEVTRGEEDPVLFATLSSYPVAGSKGMTGEIDASAQAILGPFGRFTVEPGVYYGFGWHTATSIPLDSDYGYGYGYPNRTYEPRPRFSVAGMMLGASLLFGSRDQYNLVGMLSVGKALGSADATVSSTGLGFTFAFQDD